MPGDRATDRLLEEACQAASLRAALVHLLNASRYAADTGRDIWDFAVDIGAIEALGVSITELRWLSCRGVVQHAWEITYRGDRQRTFRPEGDLSFGKRSCFVLSPEGVTRVCAVLAALVEPVAPQRTPCDSVPPVADPLVRGNADRFAPHWDSQLRELRLNGLVVKRFRVPSPNQEIILAAFEEEDWPRRVDDPLPPQPGMDPKRRLHDTIKCLNQRQINRVLRFQGDGLGRGVCWEMLPKASPGLP